MLFFIISTILLNEKFMKKLPVDFNFFNQKNLDELTLIEHKYRKIISPNYLLAAAEQYPVGIRNVICCMNNWSNFLFNQYDRCYLDVKVRNLKAGDSGDTLNQWHYDWVENYAEDIKHETHFIYTNKYGTHYLEDGVIKQCDDNSIYKYGREIHKSPVVPEDLKRVMIRLSFVNIKNKI